MKEILLTQDQVALVDDEDFRWLSQWKWFACWRPSTESFSAARNEARRYIWMSRVIMDCPEDKLVDHKNHNTLDNQKHNLRECTSSQNQQNKRKCKNDTSSRYKGVSWNKHGEKWSAQIYLRDVFDQKFKKHLGFFAVEEEAALVYDNAAVEFFGEFAYLNFPRQK